MSLTQSLIKPLTLEVLQVLPLNMLIVPPVPAGRSGSCQNANDKVCNVRQVQQVVVQRRFSRCSETVTTTKNAMLISYEVHGWEYAEPRKHPAIYGQDEG